MKRFKLSFSLFMNLSTDFTVVLLKYSIISIKVYRTLVLRGLKIDGKSNLNSS